MMETDEEESRFSDWLQEQVKSVEKVLPFVEPGTDQYFTLYVCVEPGTRVWTMQYLKSNVQAPSIPGQEWFNAGVTFHRAADGTVTRRGLAMTPAEFHELLTRSWERDEDMFR